MGLFGFDLDCYCGGCDFVVYVVAFISVGRVGWCFGLGCLWVGYLWFVFEFVLVVLLFDCVWVG